MSEQKNEQNFHSDIGQVAGESIVNHTNGPTQSNIITIHGAAPPEPPAPITELQRKAIGAKVAQIAERGGVEKIHVYRIILTHFGVNRIRELPKTDFHATMAFLDELEKGGDDASSEGDAAEEGDGALCGAPGAQAIHIHPAPCQGCIGLTDELGLVERQARAARVWAGAAMSALFVGVIGVAAAFYTGHIEAKGRFERKACYFGSGIYSVGSVLPVAGSKTRECLPNVDGSGAHWETIGSPSSRK
ncbi:hypothetical protein LV28_12380 [Pandoraea pnomenusa]|uniref:Uncharacterized protein n=1 Tax=Pandoraea pnomenusa TaxID=93220 RepID=A0A378YM43_9BURK|nr:hypothetical protein [Pandoraea pnomenusa]AIU27213.1 hypothetical protein LV28_12380 [Pandoraea pnomenusa]SUA78265.1 Uncharacterised protein [Pandoraea pnomenusa]